MNEQALRRRIDDWLDAELGTQGGARTSAQDDTQIAMAPDGDPRPERTRDQVDAAMALGSRLRRRGRNRTAGLVMAAASVLAGVVVLLPGRGAVDTAVTAPDSMSATASVSTSPAIPRDLAEARVRWASSGLRDYTLTVRTSCFCTLGGTVTVAYRDGRPESTTAWSPDTEPEQPTSVEQLFAIIESEQATADRVSVHYDASGLPAVIEADRILSGMDDEITYMTWLHPLPATAGASGAPPFAASRVRYPAGAGVVEVDWPAPAAASTWFDLSGASLIQPTTNGALDLLAALDRAVPGTSPDAGTASMLGRSAVDPAGYTAWLYRVVPGASAAEQVSWGMTMTRGGVAEPTTVFDPCGRWPEPNGLGLDDGFRSAYFEEYMSDATETCAVETTPDGRRVVRFSIVPGTFKETSLPGPQLRAFTVRPDGTAAAAVVFALPGTPASDLPQILDRLTELVLDLPYPTRP